MVNNELVHIEHGNTEIELAQTFDTDDVTRIELNDPNKPRELAIYVKTSVLLDKVDLPPKMSRPLARFIKEKAKGLHT